MSDTENETIRFRVKPNPFLYALEFTRDALITATVVGLIGGIPFSWQVFYSKRALLVTVVVLLIAYAVLGLVLFIIAFATASCLTFIITDKRAIIRFSSSAMTTDELSIAIETVKRIKINSYGGKYGSVYLTYNKTSSRENSKDEEPDGLQPGPIRRSRSEATRASVPIKRTNSIWGPMSTRLHGFYAFKGFDEFVNIIRVQQAIER